MRKLAVLGIVGAGLLGACGRGGAETVVQAASAEPIAAVARSADMAERVFSFGEAFAALDEALSWDASSRDAAAVNAACAIVVRLQPPLARDLASVKGRDAHDVAMRLIAATQSAFSACQHKPERIDDDLVAAVQLDYGSFRNYAFDFDDLTA